MRLQRSSSTKARSYVSIIEQAPQAHHETGLTRTMREPLARNAIANAEPSARYQTHEVRLCTSLPTCRYARGRQQRESGAMLIKDSSHDNTRITACARNERAKRRGTRAPAPATRPDCHGGP